MDLISREEVLNILEIAHFEDIDNYNCKCQKIIGDLIFSISNLSAITLIRCSECKYLVTREKLDEHIKWRVPKELIGRCEKTNLYVHEEDYCCGGEE